MLGANEQSGVVTTGPWMARDGFVAETSIKLDRLHARLERLHHESELVKQHVAELIDHAHQANRFHALEESLRNGREYKLDELLRSVKDAKGRLDQIEGNRALFNGLTYKSFETIDKKLVELAAFQARITALERTVKLNAALFCASVLLVAATFAGRFI